MEGNWGKKPQRATLSVLWSKSAALFIQPSPTCPKMGTIHDEVGLPTSLAIKDIPHGTSLWVSLGEASLQVRVPLPRSVELTTKISHQRTGLEYFNYSPPKVNSEVSCLWTSFRVNLWGWGRELKQLRYSVSSGENGEGIYFAWDRALNSKLLRLWREMN